MKSKCKHCFDVACLMCGFGEFEGKRVWFDWAWQEQQKRIEELESKLKAVDALSRMRAAVIGSFNTQNLNARTKRKMLILKQAEQALKGDMNEQHLNR
ncbi:hypothetical protein [Acinetobacter sp. ANC 5502]